MDNIVDLRPKTSETSGPVYHDYEIVLKPRVEGGESLTITDYGFLICNGAFYAIGRGPTGSVELMAAANAEEVLYARSLGVHGI